MPELLKSSSTPASIVCCLQCRLCVLFLLSLLDHVVRCMFLLCLLDHVVRGGSAICASGITPAFLEGNCTERGPHLRLEAPSSWRDFQSRSLVTVWEPRVRKGFGEYLWPCRTSTATFPNGQNARGAMSTHTYYEAFLTRAFFIHLFYDTPKCCGMFFAVHLGRSMA